MTLKEGGVLLPGGGLPDVSTFPLKPLEGYTPKMGFALDRGSISIASSQYLKKGKTWHLEGEKGYLASSQRRRSCEEDGKSGSGKSGPSSDGRGGGSGEKGHPKQALKLLWVQKGNRRSRSSIQESERSRRKLPQR